MSGAERYREAGVDLNAWELAKTRIDELTASARTEVSRGEIGAFGGMIRVPPDIPDPVLVMSTDSVGTKVLVSARAQRHDTVGEDLVNHCVNDILVHGASPLAFLDYVAVAAIDPDVVSALVEGVARGCRAHEMTLAGGETAELPGVYLDNRYDLAGSILGVVSEARALHGDRVGVGDALVGYASTGLHTNGYALARHIVFDELALDIDTVVDELGETIGDALLAVHRSYYAAVSPVLDSVHALAHITGGGIPGNLGRSLPDGCAATVRSSAWDVPQLFTFLQDAGRIQREEMFQVFNMGIGFVSVVPPDAVGSVRAAAQAAGVETWVIGEIAPGEGVQVN